MNKAAIFLDRDGTIIDDKDYLNDPASVEFLPNALEGLSQLQKAGYLLIVVTNQSGIARGLVSVENLEKIHQKMNLVLAGKGITISAYYYSPHAADSNHSMRKPNPGMIEQGFREFSIDRSRSWMIGDKMIDVEAGHRAGLKSILIKSTKSNNGENFSAPEKICTDLLAAAAFIKGFV